MCYTVVLNNGKKFLDEMYMITVNPQTVMIGEQV